MSYLFGYSHFSIIFFIFNFSPPNTFSFVEKEKDKSIIQKGKEELPNAQKLFNGLNYLETVYNSRGVSLYEVRKNFKE